VLRPGSPDIFHGATRTVQSLRSNVIDRNVRVKVIGTVTCVSPAGWLSLQDNTGGLMARLFRPLSTNKNPENQFVHRHAETLRVGDRIELVGFALEGRPFAPL